MPTGPVCRLKELCVSNRTLQMPSVEPWPAPKLRTGVGEDEVHLQGLWKETRGVALQCS